MLAARQAGPAVNAQLQHGEDEDGKKVYILQILQIACVSVMPLFCYNNYSILHECLKGSTTAKGDEACTECLQ